jgi:hypothetical protein
MRFLILFWSALSAGFSLDLLVGGLSRDLLSTEVFLVRAVSKVLLFFLW